MVGKLNFPTYSFENPLVDVVWYIFFVWTNFFYVKIRNVFLGEWFNPYLFFCQKSPRFGRSIDLQASREGGPGVEGEGWKDHPRTRSEPLVVIVFVLKTWCNVNPFGQWGGDPSYLRYLGWPSLSNTGRELCFPNGWWFVIREGGSPISKNALIENLEHNLGLGIIGNFARLNSWELPIFDTTDTQILNSLGLDDFGLMIIFGLSKEKLYEVQVPPLLPRKLRNDWLENPPWMKI